MDEYQVRGTLHCGISARLMTAWGHERPRRPDRVASLCLLRSVCDQFVVARRSAAWCHELPGADAANEVAVVAYSITSSASASSLSGRWRPSALAVVRLRTSSNWVDCITGRSAGCAPLRIFPT